MFPCTYISTCMWSAALNKSLKLYICFLTMRRPKHTISTVIHYSVLWSRPLLHWFVYVLDIVYPEVCSLIQTAAATKAYSLESLMEGHNSFLNQFVEIPRKSIIVCFLSLSAKASLNLPTFEIRARIFKLLRIPRIDYKEPIPPGCVAWRAGTTTQFLLGS